MDTKTYLPHMKLFYFNSCKSKISYILITFLLMLNAALLAAHTQTYKNERLIREHKKLIKGKSIIKSYTLMAEVIRPDSMIWDYLPVKGFNPIKNGATIDFNKLGISEINLRVNVAKGFREKIILTLTTGYAWCCRDTMMYKISEAEYLTLRLASGKYTLSSITYYNAPDGSQNSQKGPEISFTVINNTSNARKASKSLKESVIKGYSLVDVKTGKPIEGLNPIKNGAIIRDSLISSNLGILVNTVKGFRGTINVQLRSNTLNKLISSYDCDLFDTINCHLLIPDYLTFGEYILSSTATYQDKNGSTVTVKGPNIKFSIVSRSSKSRKPALKTKENNSISFLDQKLEVSLYPNPSTDFINISVTSRNEDEQLALKVFNTQGAEVLTTEITASGANPVRLENLTKGMYVVRVKGSTQNWSGRFIVN